MRPIHLARLDKVRPVLILTREPVRDAMSKVTVIPITGTARGLSSEVPVGPRNGLDKPSAISCDNITTIDKALLGRQIGFLFPGQEPGLARALQLAFDLDSS
jgi:mRNA interferase MazF